MKNTIKLLGILLVIAAAIFVAACGPLEPVEPEEETFTITYMNGTQTVDTFSGQKKDDPIPVTSKTPTYAPPAPPTTTAGLFKNPTSTGKNFKGWGLTPTATESETVILNSLTVTGNQTFYAVWSGSDATYVSVPLAGTGSNLEKAVATIKAASPSATDEYTLILEDDSPTAQVALNFSNIKLTIIGKGSATIKAPDLSKQNPSANNTNPRVFILVGKGGASTTAAIAQDPSISLTLKDIWVEGNATAHPDSMIRVENGASLILEKDSKIYNHTNNAGLKSGTVTTTGDGTLGNGSAICVINGGKLTVKPGAVVEENKSTGDQDNKNLVGGIFAHGGTATANATLKSVVTIEGGMIKKNTSTLGNTADIYVTDTVDLIMKGNLTIGELTLNADTTGTGASAVTTSAVIQIPSAVTNTVDKLCLRSTEPAPNSGVSVPNALNNTKTKWTGRVILKGIDGHTVTGDDVDKFILGEFRGRADFTTVSGGNKIDELGLKIGKSGDDLGKLVAK